MKRNDPVAQHAREIFAKNLEKYMERAGKKQADLSADLGITASTVSDWANAKKYPRIDKVQAIADYLGILKSDLTEEKTELNLISPTGMVPIIGEIPAGYPVLAQENIEGYMPVMHRNPKEYFYFRVRGESMINAGISTGDLVLIHTQACAENGEIVACRVNGDEATLKRFKQVAQTVFLIPENPSMEPIIVPVSDFMAGEAEIIGVARQIVKDL